MISVMDFSGNNLGGEVPVELGKNLPFLTTISLGGNKLSGGLDFIDSLSNCKQLQNIFLSHNQLEGAIPDSIVNLSTSVMQFSIDGNRLTGGIPAGFSNLSNLIFLNLRNNQLTGTIPPEIAKIGTLQALYLGYNAISGSIPPQLGQLRSLSELSLENNAPSGSIPDSIGNISALHFLWLFNNKLSSSIPRSVWGLTTLVGLYLSQNALQGSIPDTLGQLLMLGGLDLSNNSFNGTMPQSLGKLINIQYLDLSHNEFSGPIPNSLADLRHLATLNLSFNELEGQIPSGGVFSNITSQSLIGNAALCGLPKLGFSPCVVESTNSNSSAKLHKLKIILPTVALPIMLIFCCLFILYWRKGGNVTSSSETPHLHEYSLIPYHELARATDGFSESNLLGRGSSGSVYRGQLNDGLLVAVKVLDLENKRSLRSFESECGALGMIRHRNLVRIISTCSNLDFKALVLQYMPNGSLERWLYSAEYCLTLLQRINIALDAAHALEYLHHELHQVVVHCDIKPSNILLDEEMNAHLSDFGIAKLLASDSKSLGSASIAGTFGYMPPEYGSTGRVSRQGDVYSYGIVLLEIFTRKKPTDLMFVGELNLRQWVLDAYPTRLFDVLDANLLGDAPGDEGTRVEDHLARQQCLLSIIELALQCSKDSPKERISMKDAAAKMQKLKTEYLRKVPNN